MVVGICVTRRSGSALEKGRSGSVKASSRKILQSSPETLFFEVDNDAPNPAEGHIICVYVDDYLDKEEVDGLGKALRFREGVLKRIAFKLDVILGWVYINLESDPVNIMTQILGRAEVGSRVVAFLLTLSFISS